MIFLSYIINYIIFANSLYFLLFINICLLMCTLAIVDVYAYRDSGIGSGWGLGKLAYPHSPFLWKGQPSAARRGWPPRMCEASISQSQLSALRVTSFQRKET